ncbi:MAG: acetyl-CoA carboxylase biotin carboxyl carrier protein subunit [Bacteroidales bacterium]|nr:acetyl-CoA carboxylase biotin carboxyl carrier protein subunit [Bacteroidales bacterium]
MKYTITIDGKQYAVQVKSIVGDQAEVEVNGKSCSVKVEQARQPLPVQRAAQPAPLMTAVPPAQAQVQVPAGGKAVTAPLPGVIIHLMAVPGQGVRRGDKIAVLEAMKMENDILAPADGQISDIAVHEGDSVLEGAVIATMV